MKTIHLKCEPTKPFCLFTEKLICADIAWQIGFFYRLTGAAKTAPVKINIKRITILK